MSSNGEIQSLLQKIEDNQRAALELQREHLEVAQAQLERSNKQIQESLELQRTAVARQLQLTKFLLPVVGVLIALVVYLMIRWNIL